jgi:hypothetical protein
MEQERVDEYLINILHLHGLANGYASVIKELSKYIILTEIGQAVYTNLGMKQEISKTLDCSIGYINNCMTHLYKANILQKQSSGTYIFNPDLFGYNDEWKNINMMKSVELNITITPKGKEIKTTFKI